MAYLAGGKWYGLGQLHAFKKISLSSDILRSMNSLSHSLSLSLSLEEYYPDPFGVVSAFAVFYC
jgi:hypothetical protein